MSDDLKSYIEDKIGFLDDEYYYNCIKDFSEEMVPYKVSEELKMYYVTHRSDLLSPESYNYVKKREKYFKYNLVYYGGR